MIMIDFNELIAGSPTSFDAKLQGGNAIADYIETFSTSRVDHGLISELYHRCTAVLQSVSISDLVPGHPDANSVSKSKMKRYSALDLDTMPPIVVDDGRVMDGNHRFKIAKQAGAVRIWAYVIVTNEEELTEAPISDFELIGDWSKNHSFRHAQDRKLLQNPKAVTKIKAMWNKTDYDFNLMFLNAKGAGKFREVGFVDRAWLEKNLTQYLDEIKIDGDAINVLYTNNDGAERIPMTGWVIAHRLFHAASRDLNTGKRKDYHFNEMEREFDSYINRILNEGYGIKLPRSYETPSEQLSGAKFSLYKAIGTMKSARDGQILRESEFLIEILTQYLLTGTIKFNPLPAMLPYGRSVFGRRNGVALASGIDAEIAHGYLEDLAEVMEHNVANVLGSMIGTIIVM